MLSACAGEAERSARRTLRELPAFAGIQADAGDALASIGERGAVGDYVAYALSHNPSLRADYQRWRASVLRISRARRIPEPTVSYAYYVRRVQTRVGPQRHRLSLRQAIPWPTVLSHGASAAARRAEHAAHRFDARVLAVRAAVELRYWRVWMLRGQRRVRADQLGLVSDMALAARGRVESGGATLADLQQIEVTRARLEDSLAAFGELERAAVAQLVAAIGAPAGTDAPIDAAAPPARMPDRAIEELRALVRNHPDLNALAALSEANRAAARQATAEGLPRLTLGVDWIETGESLAPTAGSGDDAVIVSVGASVPLQRRSYREARDAARAAAAATEGDRRAAEDALIAQLETELASVRDSYRRVALHRNTLIPQAQATYEAVLGAYQVGRGSLVAILLAQRDLLELGEALIQLQATNASAWARTEALAGHELMPRELTQPVDDQHAEADQSEDDEDAH